MPYLGIHISKTLTTEEREQVKSELGAAISLIPNKREELLMVEFLEGSAMYLGGQQSGALAYVDLRCYKSASYEENKAFTEEAYRVLREALKLEAGQVYMTITEYQNW